jgi:hypothetical protein
MDEVLAKAATLFERLGLPALTVRILRMLRR